MDWQPIETAPKDGTRILLARHGWTWWDGDAEVGSPTWRKYVFGEMPDSKREYRLHWCTAGFWSERWSNWNDGVEPCGLASPTHWIPLPTPPQGGAE